MYCVYCVCHVAGLGLWGFLPERDRGGALVCFKNALLSPFLLLFRVRRSLSLSISISLSLVMCLLSGSATWRVACPSVSRWWSVPLSLFWSFPFLPFLSDMCTPFNFAPLYNRIQIYTVVEIVSLAPKKNITVPCVKALTPLPRVQSSLAHPHPRAP